MRQVSRKKEAAGDAPGGFPYPTNGHMGKPRNPSWLLELAMIVTIWLTITNYQADWSVLDALETRAERSGKQATLEPKDSHRCANSYAPGIVLVRLRQDHRTSRFRHHAAISTIPGIDVVALRVPVGQECAALETLRRDPRVAFAELDYAVHATTVFTPNDPGWTNQWGPARIGAPAAWGITTGTPDVIIAVLDSGTRLDHEDLVSNLWSNPGEIPDNDIDDDGNGKVDDLWGWRFYHEWNGQAFVPGQDNIVTDDLGHGTHVAGIAGAGFDNGLGIAGMAGGSRLMTVRVLDQYGDGWYSDLAQGIVYAVDNGARIINLSVGGGSPSETLQEAINYAHAHRVLVVAATGNDGGDVLYPAACEHVLAVAATDQNDDRAGFSNHGPRVDVAAPGVDTYSTWYLGGYFTKSGTSMATAHVSGLAALVWSARPDLTVDQATEIITGTAADVNGSALPGWDEYLGWGRIEAGQALSAALCTGTVHLTTSRHRLSVGESTAITATVPLVTGTANLFTFAVSGGTISPTRTTLGDGVLTATLLAGPRTGMAVVTGTTGLLSGTLFLRLLPGPTVSATLTPASREVTVGHSLAVTLTASDGFGNPPLNHTTSIEWTASGGMMAPDRSQLFEGISRSIFTAGPIGESAVITASLESGLVTTVIIDVYTHLYHLPVILRCDGSQHSMPDSQ